MKKLFIISSLIILALAGQSALAQNNRGNGEGQRQRQGGERISFAQRQSQILENLTTSLSLTEDQITKAKELNKKYDEKFTTIRNTSTSPEDRQAQRGEMRKLMEQYNVEFKAILTKEQAEKYDKLQQERRENNQRERQRPGNNSGERNRERTRTR